jgi:HK97 gp10 family phage protein
MAETRIVSGLSELDEFLKLLPARVEGNVLRGGLRAGAKVMAEQARTYVPVRSGALRKSIRYSVRLKNGTVVATIRAGSVKAYYAQIVEFGSAQHFIRPKNKDALLVSGKPVATVNHPGSKQTPYMRPAFDHASDDAIAAVANYIRNRLPIELNKHVQKRGAQP